MPVSIRTPVLLFLLTAIFFGVARGPSLAHAQDPADNADRIQPYAENPFYWQYLGEPVLLIGGSAEDNLFQIDDLAEHLDLLQSVGGNYIRCTLSSRDEGDLWAFTKDPDTGLYDLEQPNEAYWGRVERCLELCAEREIILQIELWDRFDYARAPWQDNPYNPKNNRNYSAQDSGLVETIASHPGQRVNAFFRSVPALEDNALILLYQQAQIDELLKRTLPYANVLYCIDNETNESPEWGRYWALYLKDKAGNSAIQVTEMWDSWDLQAEEHKHTFDHPELYSFCDISQNNHRRGAVHWDNMQATRRAFIESDGVRPMNSVKIYGADTGRYGNDQDAVQRFWRNVIGGLASARFHRPDAGLGLGDTAQTNIRAMRMLADSIDFFTCGPHQDLLEDHGENLAYCTANPGIEYAVYFTRPGSIALDTQAITRPNVEIRWLNLQTADWLETITAPAGDPLKLRTPHTEGAWVVVIQAAE